MVEKNKITEEAFRSALEEQYFSQKKNKVDYQRFSEFQDKQNKRFEEIEEERHKQTLAENVQVWNSSLSPRWKNASFRNMRDTAFAKKVYRMVKDVESPSVWMYGTSGMGKTYISYALCRYMVSNGQALPSKILFLSESTIVDMAQNGFKGKDEFSQLFKKHYDVVVFDSLGEYGAYENNIAVMIESFIDKLYNDYTTVFFNSIVSLEEWSKVVSSTAESKVKSMVKSRMLALGEEKQTAPSKQYSRDNMKGILD